MFDSNPLGPPWKVHSLSNDQTKDKERPEKQSFFRSLSLKILIMLLIILFDLKLVLQ